MTATLPDGYVSNADMHFIDRGAVLRPSLGGKDQRMDRVGSKWGMAGSTKPMKGEDARIWIARLTRGVREKASVKLPQPGVLNQFTANGAAFGIQAANTETIVVQFAGSQVGKIIREGQFMSVIVNGNRYVYQATADATVGGASQIFTVGIQPPIRATIPNGAVVEVVAPRLEGYVRNEDWKWSIDNAKIYGLSFSIDEAE